MACDGILTSAITVFILGLALVPLVSINAGKIHFKTQNLNARNHSRVIGNVRGRPSCGRSLPFKVEIIKTAKPVILGEGPHWDIPAQSLYYVDIVGGSVHRYKPSTGEYYAAVVGNGSLPVTLIIPLKGQKNKFVISLKNKLAIIEWDGKAPYTSTPEVIVAVEEDEVTHRMNDGKADAKGRIWAGTMNSTPRNPDDKYGFDPVGALYKVDNNKNVDKVFTNIHISNGLAWSNNSKKFYYIDSCKYSIEAYDFDNNLGEVSNGKTIFDLKLNKIDGLPDGMTIDADGKLFLVVHDGNKVLRIDPDKQTVLSTINIPAQLVTSAAFGGPALDELYVTSAKLEKNAEYEDGVNGYLYKITNNLGIKGLPMFNAKINDRC